MRVLAWICFIGFSVGLSISAYATDEQWFAPVIIEYMNGDFVGIHQGGLPLKGKHECLEKLQRDIGNALGNASIPHGGSVIGGCIPIPPAPQAVTGT